MSNKKKILYDIGYGNSKPVDFLKRLTDAGITSVVDVRRKGSKSWHPDYRQGNAMASLLWGDKTHEVPDIEYGTWPCFGNNFDELWAYKRWVEDKPTSIRSARGFLCELRRIISKETGSVCLLCSERDAYKDGEVNCHRVYVADALVKLLGDEWSVKHI